MQGCLRRWLAVLTDHDTQPLQLSLMFLLATWGVVFETGGSFDRSPTYALLALYTGETEWATIALVIAAVWFVGFCRQWTCACRWAAFAGAVFWAVLATSALWSSPATWSWVVFTTLGAQSAWVFLRGGG